LKQSSLNIELSQRVDGAWQAFMANMDANYPPERASNFALRTVMYDQLQRSEHTSYQEGAELRADARSIAALLAERGEHDLVGARDEMRYDMAQVIIGQGPEPRIVSGRNWETHQRQDQVLDDPEFNAIRMAEWSEAAKYAMPFYLTYEKRAEMGLSNKRLNYAGDNRSWVPEPERDGPDRG
jgi:hypothetical protein